ncbi:MAG: group 1 glycosyl transferase [Parcubacteria group bacterium Gr01-1014_38]|nr:MAG: group 1 glycosyl transferase [Parcubacteria group bacterium Gr01-1014_38]
MFAHRLLLLTETFSPSVGGIQAYLSGIWGALPPQQSSVVAAPQPGDRAWDAHRRYRIVRAPMRAWAYPRWRPAWQAVRELARRERIEAVVCGKALFEGRAALKLQVEFGIPFVVCTYAMEIQTWVRSPHACQQLQSVLRKAGRVVVINDQTKALLKSLGVAEERLVKLYPGVREEYFAVPPELEAFRARYQLDGKRVIATVTRLVPRKGVHVIVDALAEVRRAVPNVHLFLVGEGPEREALEHRINERGVRDAVTLLGNASDDNVRRALAVADLFALTPLDLPDDREGFGIVYIEAAAMGKPAVASRTGGIPEAVLDGKTGILVAPGDAHATAGALRELLTDDARRARLGAAARARADTEFHWKGRALLFQGMVHAMLTEQTR